MQMLRFLICCKIPHALYVFSAAIHAFIHQPSPFIHSFL